MAGRLIGEVIEWLRTPAAQGMTTSERLVLIAIADRVLDEENRMMRRFATDNCNLHERLCQIVGGDIKDALQRLADRGLEVRVEWRKDKHGNPVYAGRGHAMEFRLPVFLRVAIPERTDIEACG